MNSILLAALTLKAVMANDAPLDPTDVYGYWVTQDDNSIVEIADCGDNTPCGRILTVNSDPHAKDVNNKDKSLRERTIVGMIMLSNFELSRNAWRKGDIYNPEDGKNYRAMIVREEDERLKLKGCYGPICKTIHWTRYEGDLPDQP